MVNSTGNVCYFNVFNINSQNFQNILHGELNFILGVLDFFLDYVVVSKTRGINI